MKIWILLVAGAATLAGATVLAAEQAAPARESFVASCAELAKAMSLQGDARQRFVDECVKAKENPNKSAPADPFEAAANC